MLCSCASDQCVQCSVCMQRVSEQALGSVTLGCYPGLTSSRMSRPKNEIPVCFGWSAERARTHTHTRTHTHASNYAGTSNTQQE